LVLHRLNGQTQELKGGGALRSMVMASGECTTQ